MARKKQKPTKAKTTRGRSTATRVQAKRRTSAAAKASPRAKTHVAAKHAPTATKKPAARRATPAAPKRPAAAANRALAQRIVDVTLADRDEDILALYADDIESAEAGQPPQVGLEALRAKYAGWRAMTSATAFEPRRIAVDGNVIVIEWLGHITLAASGRQVDMHEVAVHEVKNGKIVREAFYYNPAVLS